MSFTFKDKEYLTDAEGYLEHPEDWNEELMYFMAEREHLQLSAEHLVIINTVRAYYAEFATTPPMRGLITLLRRNGHAQLASSIKLAVLFPAGAAKTAAKLAGLPKPVKCI